MTKFDKTKMVIFGVFFGYLFTFVFLLIYSALLAYTNISEKTVPTILFIIGMISVFMASSLSAIKLKKGGLKIGALIGFGYILILYLLSSILETGFMLTKYSFLTIIFYILFGVFGGIIGVNLVKEK